MFITFATSLWNPQNSFYLFCYINALWSHLPLYQEELNHCFLPLCHTAAFWRSPSPFSPFILSLSAKLRVYQIHHNCRVLLGPPQGLSTGLFLFFSWLASGLKDTLELFSAGKGDEHHHPLVLANATTRVAYHITCQGMQTWPPAYPVSFLCSKPLWGMPKGDESNGRLWKLYTAFNT